MKRLSILFIALVVQVGLYTSSADTYSANGSIAEPMRHSVVNTSYHYPAVHNSSNITFSSSAAHGSVSHSNISTNYTTFIKSILNGSFVPMDNSTTFHTNSSFNRIYHTNNFTVKYTASKTTLPTLNRTASKPRYERNITTNYSTRPTYPTINYTSHFNLTAFNRTSPFNITNLTSSTMNSSFQTYNNTPVSRFYNYTMNHTNFTNFTNYTVNFTQPLFNISTTLPVSTTFRFNSTGRNNTLNSTRSGGPIWKYDPKKGTFSFVFDESESNSTNSTNASTKFSFTMNFSSNTNSSRNNTNSSSSNPSRPYSQPARPGKSEKPQPSSQHYSGFGHLTRSTLVKLAALAVLGTLIWACCYCCKRSRNSQVLESSTITSVTVLPSPQGQQTTPRVLSRYELQNLQNRNGINLGAPQSGQQVPYTRVNTQDNTLFNAQFTQIDILTPTNGLCNRMPVNNTGCFPVRQPQFPTGTLPVQTLPPIHPQYYYVYPGQVQQMPQVIAPQYYVPTTQTNRPVQFYTAPMQNTLPQNRPPQSQNYPGL